MNTPNKNNAISQGDTASELKKVTQKKPSVVKANNSPRGIKGIVSNFKLFIQCHMDLQREKIKYDLHVFLLRTLFLLIALFFFMLGVAFLCKAFYLLFVDMLGIKPFYFFIVLGVLLASTGLVVYFLVFTRRIAFKPRKLKNLESEQ